MNAEVEDIFAGLQPGDVQLATQCSPRFVDLVNAASPRIKLTGEFLSWRLFDRQSVRTIVLSEPRSNALLLLVVGRRKGVPIGRVIYTAFPNVESGLRLTALALKMSAGLGGVVSLFISADDCFGAVATVLGIKRRTVMPNALLYSKEYQPQDFRLWPMLSDFGFEEYFGSRVT